MFGVYLLGLTAHHSRIDKQQNYIQHNDTRHNGLICDTKHNKLICDTAY
jgi:hypothetical protein